MLCVTTELPTSWKSRRRDSCPLAAVSLEGSVGLLHGADPAVSPLSPPGRWHPQLLGWSRPRCIFLAHFRGQSWIRSPLKSL